MPRGMTNIEMFDAKYQYVAIFTMIRYDNLHTFCLFHRANEYYCHVFVDDQVYTMDIDGQTYVILLRAENDPHRNFKRRPRAERDWLYLPE